MLKWRVKVYVMHPTDPIAMPTRLKRISVALDDELYAKLEEVAAASNRSVSNQALTIIESVLFPGGRKPRPRSHKRGGKRSGAGRKPKVLEIVQDIVDDDRTEATIEPPENPTSQKTTESDQEPDRSS
jgi:hypothetical protein